MNPETSIRIATRASELARWQANWVADRLRILEPDLDIEMVLVESEGDRRTDRSLEVLGGTGLFTRSIQEAVLEGRADLAVHSLKDLPTQQVDGLVLAAIPERGPVEDCLVTPGGEGLDALSPGARVATSSPRRRVQILDHRPDLVVVDVRGNVPTRLAKLDRGEFEALLLARAGLVRLGLAGRVAAILDPKLFPPAPGQGALALEVRTGDSRAGSRVRALDDPATRAAVTAERSLLARLEGGCRLPVGALAGREGNCLVLRASVRLAGDVRLVRGDLGAPHDSSPRALGEALAQNLLAAARPLEGCTVVVTRAAHQAEELINILEARGARVEHFPTIRITGPESSKPLEEALARLETFDFVLFTSANAVGRVLAIRSDFGPACERGGAKVLAVGEATAVSLEAAGVRVFGMPRDAQAEALADHLQGEIEGRCFLLPRAERSTSELPRLLREQGASEVCEVTVYRTVTDGGGREEAVCSLLDAGEVDWLTFTSGSTLDGFCELVGEGRLDGSRQGALVASIGPVTSGRVRERGGAVSAEAAEARAESLVESIVRYERRRDPVVLSGEEPK